MFVDRIKLVACLAAISAAYVEIIKSIAENIAHPPGFWAVIASVIPTGLWLLRQIERREAAASMFFSE